MRRARFMRSQGGATAPSTCGHNSIGLQKAGLVRLTTQETQSKRYTPLTFCMLVSRKLSAGLPFRARPHDSFPSIL
jgi:hypothetical protein